MSNIYERHRSTEKFKSPAAARRTLLEMGYEFMLDKEWNHNPNRMVLGTIDYETEVTIYPDGTVMFDTVIMP